MIVQVPGQPTMAFLTDDVGEITQIKNAKPWVVLDSALTLWDKHLAPSP